MLYKFNKKQQFFCYFAGVFFLLIIWFFLSLNISLLPSPIVIFLKIINYFSKLIIYKSILISLFYAFTSFIISFIIGIFLGALAAHNQYFNFFLKPIIIFLKSLPTIAIIILMLIFFKSTQKIQIIILPILVIFPLFYTATFNGLRNINKNFKDELILDNLNIFNSFFKIYLPMIKSYILLASIQAFNLSLKISLTSETITGCGNGLGRLIFIEYNELNIENILSLSLIAILIIVIFDIFFSFLIKKNNF